MRPGSRARAGSANGAQYAEEQTGSGRTNIYPNSKWLVKLSGNYLFPWDINVSGFCNHRQGYPFPQSINSPSRPNRGGIAEVWLDPHGDVRYTDLFTIDFRVDKTFNLGQTVEMKSNCFLLLFGIRLN